MKSNRPDFIVHLTNKPLLIIISLQLALVGSIGFDELGLSVPLLREVIGFVYLTFVPGFLIFTIFKVNHENATETLLYSVGLSLAFLMFVGALINSLYPLVGIPDPISEIPLFATFSTVTLILCMILYFRTLRTRFDVSVSLNSSHLPPLLFLLLIPFISIFGSYLNRYFNNSIILLSLLIIIASIPLLVAFDKIPSKLYAFAIFIISISLLYFGTLHTPYLTGRDSNWEYYIANLVKSTHRWDPKIPFKGYAMLGITMLRPIYSIITGLSLNDVYKLTAPLIFSFVPLGIYEVARRQTTDDKIAFLSSFFFMSFWSFYTKLAQLYRQQLAMLFLILLILSITHMKADGKKTKHSLLILFFSFGLITSHYGTSYLFMFILIGVVILLAITEKSFFFKNIRSSLSANFAIFYVILAMGWYMYVASGSLLATVAKIGEHIITNIRTAFFSPELSGMRWVTRELYSPSYEILRWLHYLTLVFIFIGLLLIIYRMGKKSYREEQSQSFQIEHILFSILCVSLLLAWVVIPTGSPIDLARVYPVTLLWLAPICIVGGLFIIRSLAKLFGPHLSEKDALIILALFFGIFLLFNSGFVPAVTGEYQYMDSLAKANIEKANPYLKADFYSGYYTDKEVYGAKWLAENRETKYKVYAGWSSVLLWSYGEIPRFNNWPPEESEIYYTITSSSTISDFDEKSYIYLREINYIDHVMINTEEKWKEKRVYYDISALIKEVDRFRNKIYSNRGSVIYS